MRNQSNMMQRYIFLLVISLIMLGAHPVSAISFTIDDNYLGGNNRNTGNIATQEVIGDDQYWAVNKMDVDLTGSVLTVDVYSRFLNNIGYHNVYMGDLFISVDGWDPEGIAPYNTDIHTNGEDWEYVLSLDYNRYLDYGDTSGTMSLYEVDDAGTIVFPETQPQQYQIQYYRGGQEIYYLPSDAQTALGSGTWSINNLGGSDMDDYIRFVIDHDFLQGFDDIAFRWEMTCANDVIEGSIHVPQVVPEPSTLILLGSGLMGVSAVRLRKKKQ